MFTFRSRRDPQFPRPNATRDLHLVPPEPSWRRLAANTAATAVQIRLGAGDDRDRVSEHFSGLRKIALADSGRIAQIA
jgi:hypothetical protein